MSKKCVFVGAIVAAAGLAVTAQARPIFPEVEPNDTKAAANAFTLGDGDGVTGMSTGSSTITPGNGSADYFLITNAARPLGIYRHRMVLTIPGTAFPTATIRGLNQVGAAAGPWPGPVGTAGTTDTTIQTGSSVLVASARTVQWYGFGKQEQLYYRVTGTTSTTANYTAILETEAVNPTFIGNFNQGSININTVAQGHTTDTDFWVYDSNLDPIAGYGNDDNSTNGGGPGGGLQSWLTRDYAPGTYYIAMTTFNFANDQGSPSDDNFRTGAMMDFANVAVNSGSGTNQNMQFSISDGVNTFAVPATHAAAFDIAWFSFTVIPTPSSLALLGLGGLIAARRRRA